MENSVKKYFFPALGSERILFYQVFVSYRINTFIILVLVRFIFGNSNKLTKKNKHKRFEYNLTKRPSLQKIEVF